MLHYLGRLILWISGFRIEGEIDPNLKKAVVIVIPHTSNWDMVIGLAVKYKMRIKINFIGKKSIFVFPFGYLFRFFGGEPVDRTKSNKLVEQVVDLFNKKDKFILGLSPEGTRSKVQRLKTGFYYIALKAKVPIVMVKMDYVDKIILMDKPFYPSGVKEVDFERIYAFFKGAVGKNPEQSFVRTIN